MRKIALWMILSVAGLSVGGVGCAGGEFEPVQHANDGENDNQTDDQNDDNDQNDGDACEDVDCSASEVCDPDGPECVDCLEESDCPGDEACETSDNVCVDCLSDQDCPGDLVCDVDANLCTGCEADADCPDEQVCEDGDCVDCTDEGDCSGDLICEANECVECAGDGDCADELICDDGECVECAADKDCDEGLVCDPVGPECVECLEDGDCFEDLVCDDTGPICVGCVDDGDCDDEWICDDDQTCVECLDDGDCDDGKCQPDNVCTPPCCEFEEGEEFFHDHDITFDAYEMVVDDSGTPMVGFVDREQDEIGVASRLGSTWQYDIAQSVDDGISNIPYMDIALDDAGHPHLAVVIHEDLTYHWRDSGGWNSELLDVYEDLGSFGRVGLAVDDDTTAHVVVNDSPEGEEFHYYWRETGGATGDEPIETVDDDSLLFVDVDVLSDQRPVFATGSFSSTDDSYVYERTPAGGWSTESLEDPESQNPMIAVDDNDKRWVSTQGEDGPLLWEETGSGWTSEEVDSEGSSPRLDLDADGDPHLVYQVYGDENRLFYSRKEDGDWEQYDVGDFGDYTHPKFAIDDWGNIHVAGRKHADHLIYFTNAY